MGSGIEGTYLMICVKWLYLLDVDRPDSWERMCLFGYIAFQIL